MALLKQGFFIFRINWHNLERFWTVQPVIFVLFFYIKIQYLGGCYGAMSNRTRLYDYF